jgi:dihydrofolate synthase / folylpolyglutamate synthase
MYAQLPMYQRIGSAAYKKDLFNTIALCEACGNPHLALKTIHIAGTNGKGTTSHIIAAGLQAQGYKVAVYTSPHYKDFRERIKINGVYISQKYIVSFIHQYRTVIEHIQPSFFEMTVALAFSYFRDQEVDYAVIETGLGGRLDSTNIITPILSVITNISFDHQSMLGHTLPLIAAEKAGIIKSKVPVIIGEMQEEVREVFLKKAVEMKAPITWADSHLQLIKVGSKDGFMSYDVKMNQKQWIKSLSSTLQGPFQEKNLVTGLYALHQLSKQVDIEFDKVKAFFPHLAERTGYMGRWQILKYKPLTIADSAHNEGGLRIVIDEIVKYKVNNLHIVMGFVNDKDVSHILQIFPKSAKYYFAKADIPRGLDAHILRDQGLIFGLVGNAYRSVRQAYAAARMSATDEDMIYVGGSIFVVAEVL